MLPSLIFTLTNALVQKRLKQVKCEEVGWIQTAHEATFHGHQEKSSLQWGAGAGGVMMTVQEPEIATLSFFFNLPGWHHSLGAVATQARNSPLLSLLNFSRVKSSFHVFLLHFVKEFAKGSKKLKQDSNQVYQSSVV